jgi:hypothetical protein
MWKEVPPFETAVAATLGATIPNHCIKCGLEPLYEMRLEVLQYPTVISFDDIGLVFAKLCGDYMFYKIVKIYN